MIAKDNSRKPAARAKERGIVASWHPLADLVMTAGHESFPRRLAAMLQGDVPHDILGAYFIDRRSAMRVLFTSGGIPTIADFPQLASQHYAGRFWRDDPAANRLLGRACDMDRSFVARQRWDEIPYGEYRSFAYEAPSMLERVSLMRSSPDGCVLVSLYRTKASGNFSADEITLVENQADILAAATVRHFQLSRTLATLRPDREAIAAELGRWAQRLSNREVEVCSALLSEHSVKQAVRVLGMQTSTFLTYRKRAFAKLGIATLVDLRRLYERQLAG
ncbi:MAG TPA: hypothetical protein VNR11_18960 [Xanthobacteraceae bacterium]|nr:hypothetical protein [Xanthobacteraceae bacterium]